MKHKTWFFTLGFLDTLIILSFFLWPSFVDGGIPIYTQFISAYESGQTFFDHSPNLAWIFTIPFFMTLTVFISGPLLLMKSKFGIVLGLIQSPFRLIGFMMPTFFFVRFLSDITGTVIPSVVVGLSLEIFKIHILIKLLRGKSGLLISEDKSGIR